MNADLTIYLADDHEIVAEAIAGLLTSIGNVKKVQTFGGGKELYMFCKTQKPDLIILDIEMPGWSGLQTLEKIKEICSVPVIILSMNDEKVMVEKAVQSGASGYLHKNCTTRELEEAITSVLMGKLYLSEEVKKTMLGLKGSNTLFQGLSEPLTGKEFEVLQLVCEGLSSKEIAGKLCVSPRTVEARKNSLMQKFNVQTTGKLMVLAIKNKIVK